MTEYEKHFRWLDLPALFLLVAVILTAATRLVSTGWTRHLDIIQIIALLGLILGSALAYSRFSNWITFIISILYGMIIVSWQLVSILKDELVWVERLQILYNRSLIIISQLLHQEVIQDSLLFLIFMSILFWVLGIYSSFSLIRNGNAWFSIAPIGLTLLVIQSFDSLNPKSNWYMAVFFFFSLLIVTRMVFVKNRVKWKFENTAVPPHLGLEIIRISILAVIVVILLTWAVPALAKSLPAVEEAWRPIDEIWLITQDKFSNAFASLRTQTGSITEYYGKNALLGRGNQLTETRMFSVKSMNEIPEGFRVYWKARSYDQYINGLWKSTENKTRIINPDDTDLQFIHNKGRLKRTFEFITATPMTTLILPSQPIWVSRSSLVELLEFPDGILDVSTVRASPDLKQGQVYRSQASLGYFSETQLRKADVEYPDWITDRYLQIPESITPRTIELAQQITAEQNNPYDKAVAITEYLRENIEYIDTLPPIPDGQDSIDWVLFDLKQGFCNYFATAEVILLRSIGIPSRLVIGYAQGEQITEGEFLIRQSDAHAWPEVFFSDYGWVEFEPTSLQPTLIRPKVIDPGLIGEPISQGVEFEEPKPGEFLPDQNVLLGGAGISSSNEKSKLYARVITAIALLSGLVLVVILLWNFRHKINLPPIPVLINKTMRVIGIQPPKPLQIWERRSSLQPLTKAYQEINYALSRLGYQPDIADTPSRRGEILSQILPQAEKSIKELLNEYQTGSFSLNSIELATARKAGLEIRRSSYKKFFQKNIFNRTRSNTKKL
ncbi:MAG: transglutaminase-like domain-containing protein [Anaerolineales bacterium]